jgi:SAM-dependent methyltransferase
VDASQASVESARQRYGNERARFTSKTGNLEPDSADLVYSNGTFHHIDPVDRPAEIRMIFECLAPDGVFALWENNPWNLGTRLVMRRIPFDRDAKPLSYLEAQELLNRCGFQIVATSFHFYFPAFLRALRRFEPYLERLPLGAQYCVLARRPS